LNCKMVGKPANPYKALSPPWPPAKLLHMRGRLNRGRGRAWRFDYSTRGGFWVLAPSAVSNLIESSWLKGVGFPLYLGWKPRKNGWPQHQRCACLLALLRAWSLRPDRLGIGVKGRGPATENGEIKQPKLGITELKGWLTPWDLLTWLRSSKIVFFSVLSYDSNDIAMFGSSRPVWNTISVGL
jgi:hypothetical protein